MDEKAGCGEDRLGRAGTGLGNGHETGPEQVFWGVIVQYAGTVKSSSKGIAPGVRQA